VTAATLTPAETWAPVPGFPGYAASDRGQIRNRDGRTLKPRVSNSGYLLINLIDAAGRKQTRTVHTLVMLAHEGPPPPGKQVRHWNDDPLDNRWAPGGEDGCKAGHGNLVYGTKLQNAADKRRNRPDRPPGPAASFDCINHERCGGRTRSAGSRCPDCVQQAGAAAAAMLADGVNLAKVAARLGYHGDHWVHQIAVKHGGCQVPLRRARAQGLTWAHRTYLRVRATLRATLRYWRESAQDYAA
jgi:hypothetical protein